MSLSQLGWPYGQLVGFDLETTSTNPHEARIVTGAVVQYRRGQQPVVRSWVSDVGGEEIPVEAARVHGYTTEAARAAGRPAVAVVEEITTALAGAVTEGHPLVIMHASYVVTVLDREARRYGVSPLLDRVSPYVLDPDVMDRRVSRRPGKRTLTDLCAYYGLSLGNAHSAAADAVAACALVVALGRRYRSLSRMSPAALHRHQAEWARDQRAELREYFARTPGKAALATGVQLEWPLLPFETAAR